MEVTLPSGSYTFTGGDGVEFMERFRRAERERDGREAREREVRKVRSGGNDSCTSDGSEGFPLFGFHKAVGGADIEL